MPCISNFATISKLKNLEETFFEQDETEYFSQEIKLFFSIYWTSAFHHVKMLQNPLAW